MNQRLIDRGTQKEGADVRSALDRTLNPRSVAIVGVNETSILAAGVRRSMAADAEFFFVHPKATSLFGHDVYPNLQALGRPVDVVYTAVRADISVGIIEDAAEIGAGGVISIAGGFAELGADGLALQNRLEAAARGGGMHVVGPNGVGVMNVRRGLDLTILPAFDRRPGGLSAAMHSGAMIESMAAAAWRVGGVGLNMLVSAGNEAVTDLADYLNYFADDPGTKVIALAIEKIRRPDEFFAAARRCLELGKPIVALKLGRSERAQRMAASHTGTLTGDTWVYDVALEQAGIQRAYDIDDLVDRVQFLEQLPRERWTSVRGLGVITATGGFAQLASDLADEERVDIPEVPRLRPFLEENIPGVTVPNPLDATGFIGSVPGLMEKIFTEYAGAPELDTFIWASQHADWDSDRSSWVDDFARVSAGYPDKAFIVAPLAGVGGSWLDGYRSEIGVGNGLRGCLRGIHTMGAFGRTSTDARVRPASEVAELPRPAGNTIQVREGEMLGFGATMKLLQSAGIPVAPWHLIGADEQVTAPAFEGPYVVKLADVAHRTEHDAVRVKVAAEDLDAAVAELRTIAVTDGLPATVAVQPMVAGHGEAFVGIQGESELGPVVAFGLGGVLVEVLKRVGGRMAPMTEKDAAGLIGGFDDTGILDGFRGAPAWDREGLAQTLVAAGQLAAGGRNWIASIDINPMIMTADGPVAVDGLCLMR